MIIGASGGGSGFIFIIVDRVRCSSALLVVRPQRRKQTQQQQLVNELRVGDEVLTAGGVYGTVTELDDDEVRSRSPPKVEVRLARRAIAAVRATTRTRPEHEDATEASEPENESDERRTTTKAPAGTPRTRRTPANLSRA